MNKRRVKRSKKTLKSKFIGTVLIVVLVIVGLSIIYNSKTNKIERNIDNKQKILEKLNINKNT